MNSPTTEESPEVGGWDWIAPECQHNYKRGLDGKWRKITRFLEWRSKHPIGMAAAPVAKKLIVVLFRSE